MEGTIVFKKRELLVVEDYWKKALEARPNGFGFMVATKTGLDAEMNEGTIDIKLINDIQAKFHDNEVWFWLMSSASYKEEDVQPFVVVDNKVLGMSEGDFLPFKQGDHSNDYYLFHKYLIPKLSSYGKDHDAIFNNLTEFVGMEIKTMCGQRGTIVLLGQNGRNVVYEVNPLKKEYEWGWASNSHGFEPVIVHDEPKIEEGVVRKVKKIISGAIASKPIASVEPIKQPVPKTETAAPPLTTELVDVEVPTHLSPKKKRHWIRNRMKNGVLPFGWESLKTIKVERPLVVKDLKELPAKYPADTGTQVTDAVLPLIPPKIIEAMAFDFKEVDKNSREIPSPDKILDDMNKHATFWEQRGIDQSVTDAWDDTALQLLCTKYANHSWILLKNYRELYLLEKMTKPRTETEPTVEKDEEDEVDTSGTGVTAPEPTAVPKWKQRLIDKKRVAM